MSDADRLTKAAPRFRDDSESSAHGKIITFYSYKGGTGRSMAMANVGYLLASMESTKGRVLLIDWDLEAPGLHRFIQGLPIDESARDQFLREVKKKPGLIELFGWLNSATLQNVSQQDTLSADRTTELDTEISEEDCQQALNELKLKDFVVRTGVDSLHLLKAGRMDDDYAGAVNSFDWKALYYRAPSLFRLLAEKLTLEYDYVLIDSRTGESDTSGICTSLMPEMLVVVFTPNLQSIHGVEQIVGKAVGYRRSSPDMRPLVVFPLASRIETSVPDLDKAWRWGDTKEGTEGYQKLFEGVFRRAYGLEHCDLTPYFNDIQIQHVAPYSYGEKVATAVETGGGRLSLSESYKRFTQRLLSSEPPWSDGEPEKPDRAPRMRGVISMFDKVVKAARSRGARLSAISMFFALLANLLADSAWNLSLLFPGTLWLWVMALLLLSVFSGMLLVLVATLGAKRFLSVFAATAAAISAIGIVLFLQTGELQRAIDAHNSVYRVYRSDIDLSIHDNGDAIYTKTELIRPMRDFDRTFEPGYPDINEADASQMEVSGYVLLDNGSRTPLRTQILPWALGHEYDEYTIRYDQQMTPSDLIGRETVVHRKGAFTDPGANSFTIDINRLIDTLYISFLFTDTRRIDPGSVVLLLDRTRERMTMTRVDLGPEDLIADSDTFAEMRVIAPNVGDRYRIAWLYQDTGAPATINDLQQSR